MKSSIRLLFVSAALLLAGAASNAQAEREPAVKVGAVLPLTGDLSMYAAAFREGLELAEAALNSKGGVDGRPLNLIIEDSRNDPGHSHTATQKLLQVDHVNAAVVSSYQDARVGEPDYQRAKVPVVVLWDATPGIDAMGDYVFSIGPWIPSAGETAARFAKNELQFKRGAIIHINSTWSQEVSRYFMQEFKRLGGNILEEIAVNPDVTDFRAAILKAAKDSPDFLYTPLDYNLLPFYRQVRQLGFKGEIISSDIISSEHISELPSVFEGIYQTGLEEPDSKEWEDLAGLYRKVYGKDPVLPWFAATGYDSLHLLAAAMEEGGLDPEKTKEALYKIQGYRGTARAYSFTAGGSAPQMEAMYRIVDGRFVRAKIPSR